MNTFIAAYLWLLVLSFTLRKPAPKALPLHWFGRVPRKSDRMGDFRPQTAWLDGTTAVLVFPKPILTKRLAQVEYTVHPLLPPGNCRPELN